MDKKTLEAVKEAQRELGRQGGLTTKKKYGKEHYQKLAEHMNKVRAEKKKAKDGTQPLKKKEAKKKSSLDMTYEP
jgi:hypothetical protein